MLNKYNVQQFFTNIENKLYQKQGISPLKWGTIEDWDLLKKQHKAQAPKTYWFVKNVLQNVEDVLVYAFDKKSSISSYLYNRFVDKPHILYSPNLKVGQYYGINHRFIECCFYTLVTFVESEIAWKYYICAPKEEQLSIDKLYGRVWYKNIFNPKFINPELGIKHLEWETTLVKDEQYVGSEEHPEYLKPTEQAINAAECLFLYNWWTKVRPSRIQPYDMDYVKKPLAAKYNVSMQVIDNSLSKWFQDDEKPIVEISNEDILHYDNELNKQSLLEQQYDEEDQQMLIRLIKISNYLWT